MKEFIEGIHFTREEKYNPSTRYFEYIRNQNQSKAFLWGNISGISSVLFFLKMKNNSFNFNKFSKLFYSINLYLAVHVFVYEIWSKMYTDKEKVFYLDKKILNID
jgi:hypothetical protein